MPRILTFRELQVLVQLSRPAIWKKERDGGFPRSIRLSGGRVGWIATEVEEWIAARDECRKKREAERQLLAEAHLKKKPLSTHPLAIYWRQLYAADPEYRARQLAKSKARALAKKADPEYLEKHRKSAREYSRRKYAAMHATKGSRSPGQEA